MQIDPKRELEQKAGSGYPFFSSGGFVKKSILSMLAVAGLVLTDGCGTVAVSPGRIYALQCGWCSQTISSGEYAELGNGNVVRTLSNRRGPFGIEEGEAAIVGNTRNEPFGAIINKDLMSQGGLYHNGAAYCSQRCAYSADQQR